ncbi:hypothetical protein H4582DRAFT_2052050 [Lactarius indigo]|nr:hypothetical protein H4582DRAFT_2052050 [Lactarius indigo]
MNNGSEVDAQHTLRPDEAHNHLKLYLADNYTFRTWFRGPNNVEGFSRILASVNSRNKAWVGNPSQAQAFLDTIVHSNALLRISDVLRFSPVAVNAGAGSSTLSYQKGYFPIIKFLSSDLVLKTTMHTNTKYFSRVKSAIKNHPELHDLVEDLSSWFNIWASAVSASPPTFQDPITSSTAQVRNLTLGELEKDMSRLSQISFFLLHHTIYPSSIRKSVLEIRRDLEVIFAPLKAERRNFTVGLVLDSPPGAPRDEDGRKRAEYWEHSKRLQQGSLVALALISPGQFQVFLGIIVSRGAEIAESTNENTIQLRISFFDVEIELMALRRQPISVDESTFAVLIDNKILFEALHPFLQTLKDVEPTSVPFADFISYSGNLASIPVGPPRYTRVPRFKYNLQCLARPGETISSIDVNDATSVAIARQELLHSSELDPSQIDAVIGTLTREISLIQGIPPLIIKSLALPERERTTDERIEQYSLYKLEQLAAHVDLDRRIGREFAVMKRVEEVMTRVINRIQHPELTWEDAERFLNFQYPQHADSLRGPPFWIAELFQRITEDEVENGEWTRVSKGKEASRDPEISGVYALWKNGRDIQFIQPRPSSSMKAAGQKGAESDSRVIFFNELGFKGQIPRVPSGSRSLEQLTSVYNVWSMSISERQRLVESWEDGMRNMAYESLLAEFNQLKDQYKDVCKVYEDIQDEARRRLLSRVDLIACTTTVRPDGLRMVGAAKLVSLLTSVGPKVLMVEEAGQVLEAHILASLVPSALSMDSKSGRELFKFDRSLMERLSDGGMCMSQINMQRRMRPSISHFVRFEDNEVVRGYPPVQGMEKDVVFFSHDNPENSEDDSVAMIRDLVLYFLKQGPYDGAGDIAVLCAYLGQLQKVRAALKDLEVAVSVDERDEEQLEHTGLAGDDDIGFAQVQVARHIRIGTVDTFQGQEAKIVIISLVRNSGAFEEANASIGFLKSSNRINVALSRAKHWPLHPWERS